MTDNRRRARPWRLLIAAVLVLLAALTFFALPTAQSLECEALEASYSCVFTREGRQGDVTHTFGASDVGSIELGTLRSGKNAMRGRVEVFNPQGVPRIVFEGSLEEATAHHKALVRFTEAAVAGKQPAALRIKRAPPLGGLGFPILLVIVAGVLVFAPVASGERAATSPAPKAAAPWRVALPVVLGVGLLAVVIAALDTRGPPATTATVEVRCAHRCRIGGIDCRPPGVLETRPPPGTYTVQVYAPNDPSGWRDRSIEVEAGQRYVLVCEP